MEIVGVIIGAIILAGFLLSLDQAEKDKEIEHQTKLNELEVQRKKAELELEREKAAGLDPLYQQLRDLLEKSEKKRRNLKIACIALVIFLLLFVLYIFFKKDRVLYSEQISSVDVTELSEINKTEPSITLSEEILLNKENQQLPERFKPQQEIHVENQINNSKDDKSTVVFENIKQQEVANPFEGNTSNTNDNSSDQLSVYDANSHVGENAQVCGEVSQISQTSKATYINFGGRYPKHKFSVVIWSNNMIPASEGSNICITGLIESYKGIPQIVINSLENQISSY